MSVLEQSTTWKREILHQTFGYKPPPSPLLRRSLLYLMTDWLPIRKHFIRPRYSKQVKQRRQDSISPAHMDAHLLAGLCPPSLRFGGVESST